MHRRAVSWAALFILCVLFLGVPSGCETSAPAPADGGARADVELGACTADESCDDGLFCNGVERCTPASPDADARGCLAAAEPACPTGRTCLESSDRCVTDCSAGVDADGDGVPPPECGGYDCDDSDPDRYPGNVEICDAEGHDEDCIPTTLAGEEGDVDGDGFVQSRCCYLTPREVLECGRDCDDASFGRNPGAIEVCNGRDDDCNGLLDHPDEDDDHDMHADDRCAGAAGADCDDLDPFTYVGADELCDGIDNDCSIDGVRRRSGEPGRQAGEDDDGDGHSPPDATCLSSGPPGSTPFPRDDCDDTSPTVHAGAVELCDGIDNDCDGMLDEAEGSTVAGSACVPISIHPGSVTTCALRADGRVVCWGSNAGGRLGDPSAPADATVLVPDLSDAVEVDVGDTGACARRSDGSVYCWGNPFLTDAYSALRVPPPSASGVVSGVASATDVSVGGDFACAVSGGRVLCWGHTCMGLLDGVGGECGTSALAREVPGITDATQVDCGLTHSCARLASGAVACWGMGIFEAGYFGSGAARENPSRVSGITDAEEVAVGASYACARLASGAVRCWGTNVRGALGCAGVAGCPAIGGVAMTPVPVATLSDAISLEAGGGDHTCALRASGEMLCWGANELGQLGSDDLIDPDADAALDHAAPFVVNAPEPFTQIGVGGRVSCAIGASASYCWGQGTSRQLGDGRTDHTVAGFSGYFNASRPIVTSVLFPAVQIVGANDHTCFRLPDGAARCSGESSWGETGPAFLTGFPTPAPLPTDAPLVHISTGESDTCGVLSTGAVHCSGRIGGSVPDADATQVAAGWRGRFVGHICFLRRDGTSVAGARTSTARSAPSASRRARPRSM